MLSNHTQAHTALASYAIQLFIGFGSYFERKYALSISLSNIAINDKWQRYYKKCQLHFDSTKEQLDAKLILQKKYVMLFIIL